MFKILSVKPDIDTHHRSINKGTIRSPQAPTLLVAAMTGILLLSGCQQQAAEEPVPESSQTKEKTAAEDSQPMRKSDSAAARIEQFQPLYVAQAQGLQQRLQAEYESLQAADASDSDNDLLLDSPDNKADATENNNAASSQAANSSAANNNSATTNSSSSSSINSSSPSPGAAVNNPNSAQATNDKSAVASGSANDNATNTDTDINTSTEVGERDLTVLKRISLEPRKPVMLSEEQLIERYQQAMEALYQPVTTPLSAEEVDTLINIATLVPQLFEHAEIAGRLSAKSPALARLVIQHQVWEQIEAQQVLDMQQMKIDQQQEFERLMAKFNETIKGYDEQIAKYEQTLKEFQ